MIDHLVIHVSKLEASRVFYTAALAPLGLRMRKELDGDGVLFGVAQGGQGGALAIRSLRPDGASRGWRPDKALTALRNTAP